MSDFNSEGRNTCHPTKMLTTGMPRDNETTLATGTRQLADSTWIPATLATVTSHRWLPTSLDGSTLVNKRGDRTRAALGGLTSVGSSPERRLTPSSLRSRNLRHSSSVMQINRGVGHRHSGRLLPLLKLYPAEEMEAHPVSTKVNNPANNGLECVEPLA